MGNRSDFFVATEKQEPEWTAWTVPNRLRF